MPGDDNNVLFASEFDSTGINKGVDVAVQKLTQLKDTQELIKQETKDFSTALADNSKQIDNLSKKIAAMPKSSKDSLRAMGEMEKQLQSFHDKNKVLIKGLGESEKAFSSNKIQIQQVSKVVNQHAKEHEVLNRQIQKLTSVNHIAAEGLGLFRRHLVDAGFAIVSGFAGGIISAALPAIIDFVQGMFDAGEESDKLAKKQKLFNEVFETAAKGVGKDIATLDIYKQKLNDTNIPANERIKIAKEYNKTAEETNKIDLKQIDNLQLINEKIEAQNKLIIQRAISVAALSKLGETATDVVEKELKLQAALKEAGKTEADVTAEERKVGQARMEMWKRVETSLDGFVNKNLDATKKLDNNQKVGSTVITKDIANLQTLIAQRDVARAKLEEEAALLSTLITPEGLTSKTNETKIDNVFAQKLAELKARLAASLDKGFASEGLIKKKFASQLNKEFGDIALLLKDKKLTIEQAQILNGLLQQINDVDLSQSLDEFRKRVADAQQKINDTLAALQTDIATKRINNIRNDFERERQTIANEFDGTFTAIQKAQRDFLKQINDERDKGLISAKEAKQKSIFAIAIFGNLLDQAEQTKTNKDIELAFKQFQETINILKKGFDSDALQLSQETTEKIKAQTQLFLTGKKSYENYQEALTKILREETRKRKQLLLDELKVELAAINKQIDQTNDPEVLKRLKEQRTKTSQQITDLDRDIAEGDATNKNDAAKKRLEKFIKYADSILKLAQSVVSFWQQVNEAETRALDRSIALQQHRVENARFIAEKGNAEYLEMEQQRLDELERKREEHARKQLAINNALTLSQATVAAITAIAQAVETGSPFAAIAAVAAVVGAIAAAYSFVNSLQPQEANFYQGTEYVDGTGKSLGVDTVPANLTIGERVVRVRENKDYWQSLSAIHNRMIPPDVLNSFVESYPDHGVPVIDFGRLSSATDSKLGFDSYEVAHKLDKLNVNMETAVEALQSLGVNVKLDEDGFFVGLETMSQKKKLRSRS